MLRRTVVVMLVLTSTACTSGGSCEGINDDHDTRITLLDRTAGTVTWSVTPPWTSDVRVRAADDGVELVGSTGTSRYDSAGALVEQNGRDEDDEPSPVSLAELNAQRERWEAVPVGALLPPDDLARLTAATALPAGPARIRALQDLSAYEVHGDVWFGRPRSTTSFRDGRVLWRREPLAGSPVTSSGEVAVLQQSNRLLAVRVSDGSPVWRRATTGAWSAPATGTSQGLVAAEGPRAYDSSEDGRVHLIDLGDGRSRWTVPVTGRPSALVRDGAGIVVGSSVNLPGNRSFSEQFTGAVARVDVATGSSTWKVRVAEGPVVAVVPLPRGVVVVANDGSIGCD